MGTIDVVLAFRNSGASLGKSLGQLETGTQSALYRAIDKGAKAFSNVAQSTKSKFSNAFGKAAKEGGDSTAKEMDKAAKKSGDSMKKSWMGVRDFIANNPITSIFLGGGILSFISDVFGDFMDLDKESARLAAIFNQPKVAIRSMATELSRSNLNVSIEEITQTMGAFAQEGLTLNKSMMPAIDSVVAFKGLIGDAADSVIPMIASFEKTGKGATNVGLMLGSAVQEWGQIAPQAIATMAKYARATGTSGNKIADGFNKIGGTLKQLGATSEEAQEFMAQLYDQDYRKMPPMFQAFAHLRKDGAAFANAIKPAMSQMQNILRGVPDHLVPQMAESLGISTEIANAMRSGLDYETAVKKQQAKKASEDIIQKRKEQQDNIKNIIDSVQRELTSMMMGVFGANEEVVKGTLKELGKGLLVVAKTITDLFQDKQFVQNMKDTFNGIKDIVYTISDLFKNMQISPILQWLLNTLSKPEVLATLGGLWGAGKITKMVTGGGLMENIRSHIPKMGKKTAGGTGDWLDEATASKSGGFFTKEKGEGIAAFFKPLTSALPGMVSAALGIAAFGAALASTVYLIGEALGGERGKNIAAFIGSIADSIGRLLKTLLESKPVMTIFETLANIIEKLANAIFKIQETAAGVGGKVLGAAMKLVGLDSSETPSTVTTQQATTVTPVVRSAEATAAMTKSLSFDASKKASDNQLLMDIRTILAASLDVERGQLGAIIDQRSIERSKLLLQELDTMRGK